MARSKDYRAGKYIGHCPTCSLPLAEYDVKKEDKSKVFCPKCRRTKNKKELKVQDPVPEWKGFGNG